MGVRRLETFAEKNPRICFDVDIKDLIDDYLQKGKGKPIIVVDLLAILSFLLSDIPWVPGGQIKEITDRFKKFIQSFIDLGAEMVFFRDGLVARPKLNTWVKRRIDNMDKIEGLFNNLAVNPNWNKHDFTFLQSSVVETIIILIQSTKCKLYTSILECDLEVAKYAKLNNCFAILSQDTDFLIYDGAEHYLSIKHFNLNKMKTKEYSRDDLSKVLNLNQNDLPLLASLIGNDIVPADVLVPFHSSMQQKQNNQRRNNQYIDFTQNFHNVAKFINKHKSQNRPIKELNQIVFGVDDYPELIESLKSYDIHHDHKGDPMDLNLGENWTEIQKLARKNNIKCIIKNHIYGVIFQSTYLDSGLLEDYCRKPFPPGNIILRKLRQKMYGILLKEKPGGNQIVEELVVSGPKSLNQFYQAQVIYPNVSHSGILKLWSDDPSLNNERMELFRFALGIDKEIIYMEDLYLIIPVATIKHLMTEGLKMHDWELNALVASIALLDEYTVDMLRKISEFPINIRAVSLYSIITKGFNLLLLLNQCCGFPFSEEMINPVRYQDGKLFQLKYREASKNNNYEVLCENKVNAIATYNKIFELLKKHV